MRIADHDLDRSVLVIAEIGNNHEGDVDVAERMIQAAARAGADAVKFQMIDPEKLVAKSEEARRAQLERFRLTSDDLQRLAKSAEEAGVSFLCTPFDIDAVDFLAPLVPAFKVASGDNDFVALLRAVAATEKPLLISTGMADLESISKTKEIVETVWRDRGVTPGLVLLHCVSEYPVAPENARLHAIPELASLGAEVGYSDHTLGIDAAVLAVAAGARVIEKHFTLDNAFSDFRDHALSAEPDAFAEMVRRIRDADRLLGKGRAPSDGDSGTAARRSAAAARDLAAGHVLEPADLIWLRPGGGFRPGQEDSLLGRALARPVTAGEMLDDKDLT